MKLSLLPKLLSSPIGISKITLSLLINFCTPSIVKKARGFLVSKNGHGKDLS
jgi:hypothetical protein